MLRTRGLLVVGAIACAMVVSACGSAAATPAPPTPKPIPGVETVISVPGGQIQVVSAKNQSSEADSGMNVDAWLTAGDTWLEVDAKVVSGSPDYKQLESVTLTTADGKTIATTAAANTKPTWWFMVPVGSRHLTMNFPGGTTVSLDSILP
jgi:hypothetical protein